MIGISGVLSAVGGGLIGLFQNTLEKKQETKRFQIEKEFENESRRIDNQKEIKLVEANIDIEKYKSIISLNEANKTESERQKKEYTDFTKAVVELNKLDEGLSKYMRPMFAIGFFVLLIVEFIYFSLVKPNNEILNIMVHFTMYTIDYILGFYFIRRGKEKFDMQNTFKKKS